MKTMPGKYDSRKLEWVLIISGLTLFLLSLCGCASDRVGPWVQMTEDMICRDHHLANGTTETECTQEYPFKVTPQK
jgi:hypothetical protein